LEYLVVYNKTKDEIEEMIGRNFNLKVIFNLDRVDEDDVYFEFFDEAKIFGLLKGLYSNKTIIFDVVAMNYSNYDGFEGLRIESTTRVNYSEHSISEFKLDLCINDKLKTCFTNIYIGNKIAYRELDSKANKAYKAKDEFTPIEVIRNIPNLGFYKAQSLGEMCKGCEYYDNNGVIHCAVHPTKKLNFVFECKDFTISENLKVSTSFPSQWQNNLGRPRRLTF
jgi:hypothetical protein